MLKNNLLVVLLATTRCGEGTPAEPPPDEITDDGGEGEGADIDGCEPNATERCSDADLAGGGYQTCGPDRQWGTCQYGRCLNAAHCTDGDVCAPSGTCVSPSDTCEPGAVESCGGGCNTGGYAVCGPDQLWDECRCDQCRDHMHCWPGFICDRGTCAEPAANGAGYCLDVVSARVAARRADNTPWDETGDGKPDPLAMLVLDGDAERAQTTFTLADTTEPEWGYATASVTVFLRSTTQIAVLVYDDDDGGELDFIGGTITHLEAALKEVEAPPTGSLLEIDIDLGPIPEGGDCLARGI